MKTSTGVEVDLSPVKLFNVILNEDNTSNVKPLDLSMIAHSSPDETEKRKNYIENGLESVANGETAVIIMAGGQATRLGADCPKMAYKLDSMVQGKPTFLAEILLQRALSIGKLSCGKYNKNNVVYPTIIFMFSPNVQKQSEEFLKEHNYFGYPKEFINFIVQGVYPCVDVKGNTLKDLNGDPIYSPNGNGGLYSSLFDSGLLEKMRSKGIKYVHIMGIDNPLAVPSCPGSIGLMKVEKLDIVNKMIQRLPGEKAGVLGLRKVKPEWQIPSLRTNKETGSKDERLDTINKFLPSDMVPTILEYSEIPKKSEDDEDKIMKEFPYANIANHLYNIDYLIKMRNLHEKLNHAALMAYHLAFKKVPYADNGKMITPTEPNAYKFEHFIFDMFHYCDLKKFGVYIAKREYEFAPIKNKTGEDSVESAKKMYIEYSKLISTNKNTVLPSEFDKIVVEDQ